MNFLLKTNDGRGRRLYQAIWSASYVSAKTLEVDIIHTFLALCTQWMSINTSLPPRFCMPPSHTSSRTIALSPSILTAPIFPQMLQELQQSLLQGMGGGAPTIPTTAKRSYHHFTILNHHHHNNEYNVNNNMILIMEGEEVVSEVAKVKDVMEVKEVV